VLRLGTLSSLSPVVAGSLTNWSKNLARSRPNGSAIGDSGGRLVVVGV
jgi:hypothetical protein